MKLTAIISTVVVLATLTSCQTGKVETSAHSDMPPYKGSAAFEQMKTLAGKWTGTSPMMGKMNTEFRVIAGGSVIEERFGEGTPMEMLSTYHDVDGNLKMTHYCALRNQPQMQLTKSTANSLTFDFVSTPGLNAAKDKHMHGATYTFIDANHFQMEGVAWENGKPAPCGPPVIFTRK
jgi:hypothetical protein